LATEAQPAKQTKVLVVEDDVMIRVVLADMLCELGYTVAAEAASIDEALEATRKTDFDLAILDADLKGRSVSPVADALVARDIRFVFVTGYGDHGLPAYRDRPTLRKPFQMDALKRALQERLWDTVVTSALWRGAARRERGVGRLRPAAYGPVRRLPAGTTGSALLPAKILPPRRNKSTSVVFTT
jgi:CheY-like chemotaxis protein